MVKRTCFASLIKSWIFIFIDFLKIIIGNMYNIVGHRL